MTAAAALAMAQSPAATPADEQDYFAELPVVLTVTRLAQPIADSPGAITILDRRTIRASGARDVADLLRLVPGYLVSGYNGANVSAAYHLPLDEFGIRNLVLVDGRSVYSLYDLGGTYRGLMTVMVDDIERIEVLRGANSAAYGANALFGVLNIITRHSEDTPGGEVLVSRGRHGLADTRARIGVMGEDIRYRLSWGRREDDGYRNTFDTRTLDNATLRADWRGARGDEVMFDLGLTRLRAGEGVGTTSNPFRTVGWEDWHGLLKWTRQIDDQQKLQIMGSMAHERIDDVAPFTPVPGILLDRRGTGRRTDLELQHQFQAASNTRVVWGAGYRHDEARSRPLYGTTDPLINREWRVFGNAEIRLSDQWLLNAGALAAQHSRVGSYVAPRWMLSYQPAAGHTLRFGMNRSFRPPTLFESAGSIQYVLNGALVGQTFKSTGRAEPEVLRSEELGYFGNFPAQRTTLDVRLYRERLSGLLQTQSYALQPVPPGPPAYLTGPNAFDYVNGPAPTVRGLEYQLRFSPVPQTELWLNQNLTRYSPNGFDKSEPPRHITTLVWFQSLPGERRLSVSWQATGAMRWREFARRLSSSRQLDLRLAQGFAAGPGRGELAVGVQAANGDRQVFTGDNLRILERRAYVTLRIEH